MGFGHLVVNFFQIYYLEDFLLSSKSNQIENLQDNISEKSSLPNDQTPSPNDLDDEIPF
jgi:hypothetical protein